MIHLFSVTDDMYKSIVYSITAESEQEAKDVLTHAFLPYLSGISFSDVEDILYQLKEIDIKYLGTTADIKAIPNIKINE